MLLAWCAAGVALYFIASGPSASQHQEGPGAASAAAVAHTAADGIPASTGAAASAGKSDVAAMIKMTEPVNGDKLPVLAATGPLGATAVTQVATGVAGGDFATFRLYLTLRPSSLNIYTIYGSETDGPLSAPPAYHCPPPFGSNIGGTSKIFEQLADSPETGWARYDSWLTIGAADGLLGATGALSSIGVAWVDWSASSPLHVPDGGVFYMDPGLGPSGPSVLVGQLTVATGTRWRATMSAQGRHAGERTLDENSDWNVHGIEFVSPN